MRAWLFVFAAIVGCKSRGTITLDFQLESGTAACAPAADARFVLDAERGVSCNDCACGSCVGLGDKQATACTQEACTAEQVHGTSLVLDPGLWAVVLQEFDGNVLVHSQCLDIRV